MGPRELYQVRRRGACGLRAGSRLYMALATGFEYWGSLLLSTIVDKLPETLAAGFEYWGSLLL